MRGSRLRCDAAFPLLDNAGSLAGGATTRPLAVFALRLLHIEQFHSDRVEEDGKPGAVTRGAFSISFG